MAAIFIVAGLVLAEKVEKKREKKRQKKASAEARYRELQIETNSRLAGGDGGNVIDHGLVEDSHNDEEEDETSRHAVDDVPPPAYEDAVQAGERREREWRAQMERRRSSVNSNRSREAASTYVRMG